VGLGAKRTLTEFSKLVAGVIKKKDISSWERRRLAGNTLSVILFYVGRLSRAARREAPVSA
jgi:hypothetical protein